MGAVSPTAENIRRRERESEKRERERKKKEKAPPANAPSFPARRAARPAGGGWDGGTFGGEGAAAVTLGLVPWDWRAHAHNRARLVFLSKHFHSGAHPHPQITARHRERRKTEWRLSRRAVPFGTSWKNKGPGAKSCDKKAPEAFLSLFSLHTAISSPW